MKSFLPMRSKLLEARLALLSLCLVFGLLNVSTAQSGHDHSAHEFSTSEHKCTDACHAMPDESMKVFDKEAYTKQLKFALSHQLEEINAKRGMGLCFAEDTDPSYIEQLLNDAKKNQVTKNASYGSGIAPAIDENGNFQLHGTRWDETATDGTNNTPGDCITLTWSIVPDGTPLSAWGGIATETNDPSDLIAFLDGIYGGTSNPADLTTSVWFPLFQGIFDAWGDESGIQYVYEANDDAAPMSDQGAAPFMPAGALGVRGDLRISGHFLDGNSGVLAYNFLPGPFDFGDGIGVQGGDMFIDTGDNFYSNTTTNSLGLRNVLTHEHGHGLGLSHSCPIEQTKLMEPFVSFAFDGVQEDDRLGAQRLYGDRLCDVVTPTGNHTGTGFSVADVSIDDETETDDFSATFAAGVEVTVVLTPVGSEYLAGPQDGSSTTQGANCSDGTLFNALTQANLDIDFLDPSGAVVATAAATGAGMVETLVFTTTVAGTHTVRIRSNGELNVIQGYGMTCNSVVLTIPPTTTISDACDCDNPNIVIANGAVTHFENTLTVVGTPGDNVTLTTGDANFLDATLTQIPDGTVLGVIPTSGTFTFTFFQAAGTGGSIVISDNDATAAALALPVCDAAACAPVVDDFDISDPCSCGNNLNRLGPDGLPTHFADILEVNGTAGQQVVLVTGGPNFLNAGLTQIANGTVLGVIPASGPFTFPFFHASGASGSIVVSVNGINGPPFAISVCNAATCAIPDVKIPTMGEWALMIFGLLILNMSVFFLRRKNDILA